MGIKELMGGAAMQDEGLDWFVEYLRQLVTARAKENYSQLVENAGAAPGPPSPPPHPSPFMGGAMLLHQGHAKRASYRPCLPRAHMLLLLCYGTSP